MKFYYTLTCVILPATMIAACSASGSKKPNSEINVTDIQVSKSEVTMKDNIASSNIPTIINNTTAPLDESISSNQAALIIAEEDKFPLTQSVEVSKPSRLMYQFGFNKQEMNQSDFTSLQAHAEYLRANPDAVLTVNGHSDTQGNRSYNQMLSLERAKKVAKYLVQKGAPEKQIIINGIGDMEPLNDVNNFSENRRVELEYGESRLAIK